MPSAIDPLARLRRETIRIKEDLFEFEGVNEDLGNAQFVAATLGELL